MIAGEEIISRGFGERIVLSHLRREMRAPKMGHPFFVLLLRESRSFGEVGPFVSGLEA